MEVKEGKDDAHRFTGKGAPGGTGGAHMEMADEKVVQKDIHYAGNGDEGHGGFRISHTPEKAAHHVIDDDEWYSGKADGEVGSGVLQRFCRCLQYLENEGHEKKEERREYNGEGKKEGGGTAHEPEGFLFIFAPSARAMDTALPMVRPAMMTIIMCITWLPMDTPVTGAAP